MPRRAQNVYKLAVAYRSDVLELKSACLGMIASAQANLLTVAAAIPYTATDATGIDTIVKGVRLLSLLHRPVRARS